MDCAFVWFGLVWFFLLSGKSLEALKRCDNDPHVITAVARRFWADRKYAKARKWFNRAITLDPNMGDAWVAYYAFELQQGTEVEQTEVLERCVQATKCVCVFMELHVTAQSDLVYSYFILLALVLPRRHQ